MNTKQQDAPKRKDNARLMNERLKALRLKKNWTQVYVATMIGTSDVEVSRWETGITEPSLYFREKLCELFGATPEALGFLSTPQIEPDKRDTLHLVHVPAVLTPLIGREQEVMAICTLLQQAEVRLLTLTGTGGVGKTRLALHIGQQVQEHFADGVYFVSLAPLQDAALVIPSIVQTLHPQGIETHAPLEYLQTFLQGKQLLLILDNFEHLTAAAPSLLALLAACPSLKLLMTSREVLHVQGEHPFVIKPLTLPDPETLATREMLLHTGAVALFVERAQEMMPGIDFTDNDLLLIGEICRRVDGLPLAIELAVPRLKLLPLPGLLERLEHRLAVLTGGPRDLPIRQQTLRNTLAWSYELLSEEEQRLFRRLSVFVGGCALSTVEVFLRGFAGESGQVLDKVTSLLDKHLLYQSKEEDGEPRLCMRETVREYAQEALAASGEQEQAQRVYANYYLRFTEEAESHLFGEEQGYWFDRLERELDNLRAVLRWSMEPSGQEETASREEIALRLSGALVIFWTVRRSHVEGYTWLQRALAQQANASAGALVKALGGASWFAFLDGEVERATHLGE